MPDSLYERDVLAWSQHQADLLRRLGQGERVNDVDWTRVAQEIEDAGRSELHSVESLLSLTVIHLLKLYTWPESGACRHWRAEILGFQFEATKRFTPSMRQKIDVSELYAYSVRRLMKEAPDGSFPVENPFTLDELLTEDGDVLLNRLPEAA
jgi:hypothetical protein